MRRLAFALALSPVLLAISALAASATTYLYSSATYPAPNSFSSPCATGPCANYTTAMRLTGSFTTAAPLAANLVGANITPTAYSFADGLTTYTNTDPNARFNRFQISTDGGGNITATTIFLQRWATGTSPHAAGDRFHSISISSGLLGAGNHNIACTVVGTSADTGVSDLCTNSTVDASASQSSSAPGAFVDAATVPTLSEWAMIAAGLGLGGMGLFAAGRRRGTRTC